MSELTVFVAKIKADITSVENWIKNVPWAAVGNDIQSTIKNLESVVAPLVEMFFPGTTSTIKSVVTPVIEQANVAAQAVVAAAGQYAAGTLTGAALTAAVHNAQASAIAAAALVEAAVAKVPSPPQGG